MRWWTLLSFRRTHRQTEGLFPAGFKKDRLFADGNGIEEGRNV